MRVSSWISVAVITAAAVVVLPSGCTQDFSRFDSDPEQVCGATEKRCGGGCVAKLDVRYGCGEGCSPCDLANADATCSPEGACIVRLCESGFADCDNDDANGCETSLLSARNCGACGNDCGVAECEAGVCGAVTCPEGRADCDEDASNGCEQSIGVTQHCGACDRACSREHADDVACVAGECVPECDFGYDDCHQPGLDEEDDGCETRTASDVDNCGECGRRCSDLRVAARSCANRVCNSTCTPGFANCTRPTSGQDDGCETSITTTQNCGSCGNVCPMAFTCSQGQCRCSTDASCDNDTPGSAVCMMGRCMCDGMLCNFGQRCGQDGQCG
ncbi:hypothetical protein [Chondromyces crocatus]|uniref:Tryptophan synthase alpha chain n=1 Tax=Chondromyces crocatus TaxID=52 RepID=A0A0K1EG89_CHOCO|nr:hypothetical protein [Chondromyces crocatus]AKT39869.1 uncharacterized protein CMC5_040200 [Chondromyces crocatus]